MARAALDRTPLQRAALQRAANTQLAQKNIVVSAMSVFARLGFAATRVEDLLESAFISRRTFYRYFRSKEEVLAGVYELATKQLLNAFQAAGTPGEGPLDAMRRALDVYLDYHVDNAALLKVLVEQAIRSDSPLAASRRRFRHALIEIMRRGVKAATGKDHDPMLYAALLSALEGLSLDLLADGAPVADVRRAKRVMHDLLSKTLAPAV